MVIVSPSIFTLYSLCLTAFTKPGDRVLAMSPVYNFYYETGQALER